MHHSTTKWVEIMLLYKGPDQTHGTANRQLDHLKAFAHVTHRADPQGPGRCSRNLLHLTGDHWTGLSTCWVSQNDPKRWRNVKGYPLTEYGSHGILVLKLHHATAWHRKLGTSLRAQCTKVCSKGPRSAAARCVRHAHHAAHSILWIMHHLAGWCSVFSARVMSSRTRGVVCLYTFTKITFACCL